ncbi:MAG: GspE/PulE family protein [Candidatus Eremiobacteraeota bacterium]|nr:GspE/PulE family protein [Candidatus Eremiobacteraeota bacterium]
MDENEKKLKGLEERAKRMKVDYMDISEKDITDDLSGLISVAFARQFHLIPVDIPDEDSLTIAMENPTDLYVLDQLSTRTKKKIIPVLADSDDIMSAISELYSSATIEEMKVPILEDSKMRHTDSLIKLETLNWFKEVVVKAINRNASDIHIETYENEIKVRYRIDGVIAESTTIPRDMEIQINNIIKTISKMKIEKRNIPQEGIIDLKIKCRDRVLRVGSLPTFYGERFVLRVTDEKLFDLKINKLGLSRNNLKMLKTMVRRRQGLILFSGPAGSGLSTSLYSTVHYISRPQLNVFTVEDPIEAPIPNVNQMEVNPRIGMDKADCIRAIMRHDPNVLMVSTIRERQIAHLLIEAALSGQLVLAGIYARDAIDTITRIRDLGIDPYFLSTTLTGVVTQRLVRLVCPRCSIAVEIDDELSEEMVAHNLDEPYNIQKGTGCNFCLGTGYKGRIGINEVLLLSDPLKSLILRGSSRARMEEQARRDGMKTLYADGLEKVAQGLTTYDEIKRVLIE